MRLLTRADFDGLACAVLLKEVGVMDNWMFVHPKDVQDGKYPGLKDDIVANVPYIPGCGLWFDHHSSEDERLGMDFQYKGLSKSAKSAARVIWEYYGGYERFGDKFDEMLLYVDKVDSGDLAASDITNPEGWVLLGFVMDPRTGLGYHKSYRISNYQLMEELIDMCRTMPIEAILKQPDVQERLERYFRLQEDFRSMLDENGRMFGNVLVLDLREVDRILPGNRFLAYTLFPEANVSIQVIWGKQKQNTVFTVGYSVTDRSCRHDVGSLMLQHGGGGHRQVGTCQVPHDKADRVLADLIEQLQD